VPRASLSAPPELEPATASRRGTAAGPPRRDLTLVMTRAGPDALIGGFTASGRPFRPGDGSDRLAGLTVAFGQERKL